MNLLWLRPFPSGGERGKVEVLASPLEQGTSGRVEDRRRCELRGVRCGVVLGKEVGVSRHRAIYLECRSGRKRFTGLPAQLFLFINSGQRNLISTPCRLNASR